MSCKVEDLITWDDPAVVLWDGPTCETAEKTHYYRIGTHGFEFNNSMPFPSNSIDGLWVPPNKYVWAYVGKPGLAQRARPEKGLDVKNAEVVSKTLSESDADRKVDLCSTGKVVTQINKAIFKAKSGGSCSADITKNDAWKKVINTNNYINGEPFYYTFGDPCYGTEKEINLEYTCGNPTAFVIDGVQPEGVYGPGFYDTTQARGEYDQLVPDTHKNPGGRIGINDIDHLTVREIRPWSDHIKDCCLGAITDPKLCGKFNTGNEQCSAYLTQCSDNDKKEGGACYNLCKAQKSCVPVGGKADPDDKSGIQNNPQQPDKPNDTPEPEWLKTIRDATGLDNSMIYLLIFIGVVLFGFVTWFILFRGSSTQQIYQQPIPVYQLQQ